MATLDRERGRVVVRVIYDGPRGAGKSTNIRRLCEMLTRNRRSELATLDAAPGESTRFLDMVTIDGGFAGNLPMRCQMISVPGDPTLDARRRRLLAGADAIVLVCDASPSWVEDARARLGDYRALAHLAGRLAPSIVVQANRSDERGAISTDEIARALGLGPEVPVIASQAEESVGVRETVVLAVRAAATLVQRRVLEAGSEALLGTEETAAALHRALLEVEGSPVSEPSLPASAAAEDTGDRPTQPPVRWSEPRIRAARDVAPPHPPVPSVDLPTAFLWPPATARRLLRELAAEGSPPVVRSDLVARQGTAVGSGTSDAIILQTARLCVKTSTRRGFWDAVDAQATMKLLAQRKMSLGDWLAPETALCVQPDADGRHYLWTIAPWMLTLREQAARALEGGDDGALGRALVGFADVALGAGALAIRRGVAVDVHPSNFGELGGRVFYLDDDIGSARTIPTLGHSLLRRVDEYAGRAGPVARYVAHVGAGLVERLDPEEVRDLDLAGALEQATALTEAGREARGEWLSALARRRGPRRRGG